MLQQMCEKHVTLNELHVGVTSNIQKIQSSVWPKLHVLLWYVISKLLSDQTSFQMAR